MKSICKSNKVKLTIGTILFLLVEILLTKAGFNDAFPVVNVLVLLSVLVLVIRQVNVENIESKVVRNILIIGCVIRVVLMYVSIYGDGGLALPYLNTDPHIYYEALDKYLYGENLDVTWYKTFVYLVMCVFGAAKEMIHLLNIICYAFSYWLLYKLFIKYDVRYNLLIVGLGVFSFFPTYALLSSTHLREGLMTCCGVIALYAFDKIMDEKRYGYILLMFVSIGVATIFHSGAIAIVVPFVLWLFFYDNEKNEFVVKKSNFILALIFVAVLGGFAISPAGRLMLSYFALDIDGIIYQIKCRMLEASILARSNYLMNIEINDIYDILLWWPVKMFYFQFSPLPDNWSSIKDVFGFLTDSIVYIISSLLFIRLLFIKKYRGIGLFYLAHMICFQLVHAWGVMNAGGAMRHRVKLFGIVWFGAIYAAEMLLRGKGNKKC